MRSLKHIFLFALIVLAAHATDYKSGISLTFGGTEGTDWAEEYFYYDKLVDDHKVVYIKAATTISMAHNSRNFAIYGSSAGGRTIIGINGLDGTPASGDEGTIRYKIDRDRQWRYKWAQSWDNSEPYVLPAYSAPFTLASQTYVDSGAAVVGATGWVGSSSSKTSYYRGVTDSVGDEWHVLSYADDDKSFLELATPVTYEWASDGKTVLFVVNPKTPCISVGVTGTGQFFTTKPKAYFTPKICDQTTYIAPGTSGTVSITLHDINGNNVFWRIGGGSFTDAGSSTKVLTDADFADGSNTLQYYYAGNAAYTKTRTVVKNPGFPSAAESHGYALLIDSSNVSAITSRLTRAPYSTLYGYYKTRSDFSGQAEWDTYRAQGYRNNFAPVGSLQGGTTALENAFVAKMEGWSYTRSGAPRSHGAYALEMVLDNSRTIDPLGFELSHSSDTIPSRELHYRGYYEARVVMNTLFAYDLIAANFRSDQVTGGMTPIQDYFIRDTLAGFAYEGMQWGAGMQELGSPGMWGGARMAVAQMIGMVLSEYSTPYYGTSGFGTVQTTYPLCPYETDELTWKAAMCDATATKTSYPNLTYYTGFSDNGAGASLFMAAGETWGGNSYTLGTWLDKAAYFDGQMNVILFAWANLAKQYLSKTDPRLEIAIGNVTAGTFIGAKDPYPQTPAQVTSLYVLNSRWPAAAANQTAYIQGLSNSDNASDDKNMDVFAFSWYDDSYFGSGGSDTTAPTVAITTPSGPVTVSNATYTALAGTASDNVGVTSVTWSNDRGGSGTATGTTSWSVASITLSTGDNVLSVVSHDAAGNNSTTATRTITYTTVGPAASRRSVSGVGVGF